LAIVTTVQPDLLKDDRGGHRTAGNENEKIVTHILRCRDRIFEWINNTAIQSQSGDMSGGIAGQMREGYISYIYGEITGYWMRWVSQYHKDHDKISMAVDFYRRNWENCPVPLTRLGAADDWRNTAVFSFDLAMMLRGLADASGIIGDMRCRQAADCLVPWLEKMVGQDELLDPYLALGADAPPIRWSTTRGPYQTKTAAALLMLPESWLPARVRQAASATLDHWSRRITEHSQWHPRLYAMEGVYAGRRTSPPALVVHAIAANALAEDEADPASKPRLDVEAQALRLLCLQPSTAADLRPILAIAERSCRYILPSGGVSFRLGQPDENIWCALFLHQALDWLGHLLGAQNCRKPDIGDLI
jgi:hypothetical protein